MDELSAKLTDGIASGDVAQHREALALPEDADDYAVARALASRIAKRVSSVEVSRDRRADPRPVIAPQPVILPDTSFLGRLGTFGGRGSLAVAELGDVRTLVDVLRAGRLSQRRAAVRRLSGLITEEKKSLSSEQLRRAADVLGRIRDVELAYELSEARSHLSGSVGRDVRDEREQFAKVLAALEREIRRYWDGETTDEPIARLPGDQRAALLMRVRDLSDTVVNHLGAVIESGEWMVERETRLELLSSLRYGGDPRLVPPLVAVLESGDPELAADAARALSRIEDPRVHPALVSAYERSVVDRQRALYAGALGHTGDSRGRDYLKKLLESGDLETIRRAIQSLESVGGPEDVSAVTPFLREGDAPLRVQAVRALGRIGDGRALAALHDLRDQTSVSAIWAEVEDAEASIRARMELRGEEEEQAKGTTELTVAAGTAIARAGAPATVRMASFFDYVMGVLWLSFGGFERALFRFERAAKKRPDWARPLIRTGLAWARRDAHAQALASFRRAIEVDRREVEQSPGVIGALAKSFLRRAEEVEKDGRHDIARGLLEEVTALDLRRAPSALRFEVSRRYEAGRRGSAG